MDFFTLFQIFCSDLYAFTSFMKVVFIKPASEKLDFKALLYKNSITLLRKIIHLAAV